MVLYLFVFEWFCMIVVKSSFPIPSSGYRASITRAMSFSQRLRWVVRTDKWCGWCVFAAPKFTIIYGAAIISAPYAPKLKIISEI